MKIFRKIRRKQINSSAKPNGLKKYAIYALGEIVLVVVGILIALGINSWNQSRLEINRQEVIAKAVLKQMKRDLILIEDQLLYMDSEEEIYDLFLTDRTLTEDEQIKKLLRGPFLVTTGFKILNLDDKVNDLLKQRGNTESRYSNLLDKIEIRYIQTGKVLSMSEEVIVKELLNNLDHIRANHEWYYKLVTTGDLDVSEFEYFASADYRNRVAHMGLIAMDGYQYDIYELEAYVCNYVNQLELLLEE